MKGLVKLVCFIVMFGFSVPAYALGIAQFGSAWNLAQSLLGVGIPISNVTYSGTNAVDAYFSGGLTDGIGIAKGVVLTSGEANSLNHIRNKSEPITGNMGTSGDATLSAMAGWTMHNASDREVYNDPDSGTPPHRIEYDGFIDGMKAIIQGLTADQGYQSKLAISDSSDYVLDTGVLLQAGIFSNILPYSIPEPVALILIGSVMISLGVYRRKKQ